jgi:hypothetical protein
MRQNDSTPPLYQKPLYSKSSLILGYFILYDSSATFGLVEVLVFFFKQISSFRILHPTLSYF